MKLPRFSAASPHRQLATTFAGLLVLALSPHLRAQPPVPNDYRVDPGATQGQQTGQDWVNACLTIEDALLHCNVGDSIWIKEGSYKPQNSAGFPITTSVNVYGGFFGDESSWQSRHGSTTYLDGHNTYTHILNISAVTSATPIVIDRVVIERGYAHGASPADDRGAGIYCTGANLTLVDCLIEDNDSLLDGGGIHFAGAPGSPKTLHIKRCEFLRNHTGIAAVQGFGGAIYGEYMDGVFVNTTFSTNSTKVFGGAVLLFSTNGVNAVEMDNCQFWKNTANDASQSLGGAIYRNRSGNRIWSVPRWSSVCRSWTDAERCGAG